MGSTRNSNWAKRLLISASFGIATVAGSAAYADFDDALRAYAATKNGEIDEARVSVAMDMWEKYALAGDVLSRQILGDLYSNQEVYHRPTDGRQYALPMPEETGVISSNPVKALAWYIIAATHDFDAYNQQPTFREINARAHAQMRIPAVKADMTTLQVEQAEREVVRILSSQTSFDLYRLGVMFQNGQGLPKDNIQALKFYRLATNSGQNANQSAARAASYLISLMTEEERDVANELVLDWVPPLHDAWNTESPRLAALERERQQLENLLAEEALAGLEEEFEGNEHLIQNALAALGLYLGEIDGEIGPETRNAVRRFQYILVEDDDTLTVDEKQDVVTGTLTVMQKVALIRQAANVSHPQSQYIYGIMKAEGIGVSVNGEDAIDWLTRASSFGYPLAHFALGRYYRDGIVGEDPIRPSLQKASFHFGQAAALGYDQAQKELVQLNYEFNYTRD